MESVIWNKKRYLYKKNMIGIYKITSPTRKVYIGQSINIENRFKLYLKLKCKGQIKLFNSLKKSGVEKHKFEILCECEISELNDKERYYQDLYSSVGKNGLNCSLTKSSGRSGKHSEETKLKISIANKGNKCSKETKLKMSLKLKGRIISHNTRLKMSLSKKPKKVIDTNTNVIYNSIYEASVILGIKNDTLRSYVNKRTKSVTNFEYYLK